MKARCVLAVSFLTGLAISPASGLERHSPQVRVESRFIETRNEHSLGLNFGEGSRFGFLHRHETTREEDNLLILVTPRLIRLAD